jgi:hypothetical protein
VDDADGTEYAIVVNASIEEPADVPLTIDRVTAGVDRLDRDDGQWRARGR